MEKLVYDRKGKIPDNPVKMDRRLCCSHMVVKISSNAPTEKATEDMLFPKVHFNVVCASVSWT